MKFPGAEVIAGDDALPQLLQDLASEQMTLTEPLIAGGERLGHVEQLRSPLQNMDRPPGPVVMDEGSFAPQFLISQRSANLPLPTPEVSIFM